MVATTKRKAKAKPARGKPAAKVLVLRTCDAKMGAWGGFKWPKKGRVKAPDWKPTAECGNGLHGLLWGEGDGSLLDWSAEAKWLVVAVPAGSIVNLDGKVKFPAGDVVFCGDRIGATGYLLTHGAAGKSVVGAVSSAGDGGTATAGDGGTATAGDGGTATAGYGGTATAGDRGTATAGDRGTATAGDRGCIAVTWWDSVKSKYRVAVAEVGENGIKAGTAYRVDGGKFVEAKAG